ncbi:uncharacterized protein PHACADRAFT_253360 [Phanerochaete carnosa HHB-10118-sp]|uniref:Uncharacterized protein n=1 Tax=Phanerochaete carnosa (strain HHB-10118-sp) TaxID=650164 RepID=K5X0N7_PHACS|nr:uncharacterized protein PHACADRAFT_253360 [Phanerochaete carnosa HHB-10118-sp]EKM56302.1 hypothetical protein PHACADRAFT_253360 [Phanerochaete carnosa HHB-10118-sp]
MLNLRQLDYATSESNSDAQQVSRFSVSFRVPSDFLGNIGEPLEYGQSERVEDNDNDGSSAAEESWDGLEGGSFTHLPGPSFTRRDNPMESGADLMLQAAERASEGGIVGSSANSGRMVAGPSTSTH